MSFLNNIKVHIDVVNMGTVSSEWSKKRFPYPHHRIYYVFDGEATLTLNHTKLLLQPGYMYLLPAFSMVETLCENFLSHYFIHFRLHHHDILDIFTTYQPVIQVEALADFVGIFNTLRIHFKRDTPYSVMLTYSSIYQLLAPFFEHCKKPSHDLLRFETVLNYIDYHLDTKLSNAVLAKIMDLNPVYFSNLFSKTFHMSPNQYIIKKRLDKAQTLLTTTNFKVNDIAVQSGFDNNMYFSRLFKNRVGLTPTEYRLKAKYE